MKKLLVIMFALSTSWVAARMAELPEEEGESIVWNVAGETGDFAVQLKKMAPVEGISRYEVKYASPRITDYPQNNTVVGELYLPADGKVSSSPAILLHILNGNFQLERLFALQLAQAGAPAFWFKLPYYGERRPPQISSSRPVSATQLLDLLDQGVDDFRRAVDLMLMFARGGDQVDVAGISMGGILAYIFSAKEERVGKICSIMSGGDLLGIIGHARETRALRQAIASLDEAEAEVFVKELVARDPLAAAPVLRGKAERGEVLMINATEDEVIPAEYALRLADALGIKEEIVWIQDVGHYSIAAKIHEVIGLLVNFFTGKEASFASEAPPVEALGAEIEAEEVLIRFLNELGMLLDPLNVVKHGQILDVDFSWTDSSKETVSGKLHWGRDGAGKYVLRVFTDKWGDYGLGQGAEPWLYIGPREMLLKGTGASTDPSLFSKGGGGLMLKLQLLANLLQYGVRVPGLLQDSGHLESHQEGDYLELSYRFKRRGFTLDLKYQISKQRVVECQIRTRSGDASLSIQNMDTNTEVSASRFEAPKAGEVLAVSASNLQHSLAMLLEILDSQVNVWK